MRQTWEKSVDLEVTDCCLCAFTAPFTYASMFLSILRVSRKQKLQSVIAL